MEAFNPKRTASEPPLGLYDITDRGHFADPHYARLRKFVEERGGKIKDLGICVGTVIEGDVKMEDLGTDERDDLCVLPRLLLHAPAMRSTQADNQGSAGRAPRRCL